MTECRRRDRMDVISDTDVGLRHPPFCASKIGESRVPGDDWSAVRAAVCRIAWTPQKALPCW